MSGFQKRYDDAEAWELALIEHLKEFGWLAYRFGQAQIPKDARKYLWAWRDSFGRPSLIRWLPDILAIHPGRADLCLIDAKTEIRESDNYSVEVHAVEADDAVVREWNTPVYYVWPDGGVLTPAIVLNRWWRRLDGKNANGSKTSFYLVDKSFQLWAPEIFGAITNQEAG